MRLVRQALGLFVTGLWDWVETRGVRIGFEARGVRHGCDAGASVM